MDENKVFLGLYPMYFFTEAEIHWKGTIEAESDNFYLPYLRRRYHIRWWNGIRVEEKAAQVSEINKRNRTVTDQSISQVIQTENHLLKLKWIFQRKYYKVFSKENMKKCLDHMKKQFSKTFDASYAMSTESQSVIQDS